MIYKQTDESQVLFNELLTLQDLWDPEGIPEKQFKELTKEIESKCEIIEEIDNEIPVEWKEAIEKAIKLKKTGMSAREIIRNI